MEEIEIQRSFYMPRLTLVRGFDHDELPASRDEGGVRWGGRLRIY